ncbi:MAG: amino acid ABC transporter substrate-binding protein [Burkholderiales bacterium]|nr:amino acid ABC transporter substrate-binding protein [Burkholderiales bacterium]
MPPLTHRLAALLAGLALTGMAVAEPCTKVVAWEHSPSYTFKDAAGQLKGLDIELATRLLARVGCEARFVEMPLQRALIEMEAGRVDLRMSTAHTTERERMLRFTRPTESHANLLIARSAALAGLRPKQLGDLRGTNFRLAAQIQSSYGPAFDGLKSDPVFAARIVWVRSHEVAWRMLAAGRVDGLFTDQTGAQKYIQQHGLQGQVHSVLSVPSAPASIAASRRSVDAAFLQRLDAALGEVIASGELKALYQRHGICAAEPHRPPCEGR